jgi:predicted dehydrogenase
MSTSDALELRELARGKGLYLSAAPCSVLSSSARTMWQALRDNRIGRVHVVYAELDDGMVHRMPYERWRNGSGVAWPYRSEFETGCTLEHAGYTVTWLAAFFGPATSITAFSACQVGQKRPGEPIDSAADFSVACIGFASGVVARLTCSILAPRDHSMHIIGEEGVLSAPDSWLYDGPVHVQRWLTLGRRTMLNPIKRRCAPAQPRHRRLKRRGAAQMDYLLGVQELCDALREARPNRLSADFCVHTNEIVLAIHNAGKAGTPYIPRTTFDLAPFTA